MVLTRDRHLLRNAHRKSRWGCRDCKQRHVKCDETHPACTNCVKSGRTCSFTRLQRVLPLGLDIRPRQSPESSIEISLSSNLKIPIDRGFGARLSHIADETRARYSIHQLELFSDFENKLGQNAYCYLPKWDDLSKISIKEAFRSEYLMDTLIAVAAAYRSSLATGQGRAFYRDEATRLLGRSVAKFNAQREITESQAITAFLFTLFVGQLVIFDIFFQGGDSDLITIIERLGQCIKLHYGVREVLAPVWHKIEAIWPCVVSEWQSDETTPQLVRDCDCSALWEMLSRAEISDSSRQVYTSSIEALQSMLDQSSAFPLRRMSLVQEWLVRVPAGLIDLISQRRPEALVILAHYGILLHRACKYWAVGNAGKLLVHSISTYLGDNWLWWLRWPITVVNSSPG
ncbi:hypothetical protein GGR56DRAFT_643384 [Xylariaceae sp. FL0804]|nr:hypothetical protein GGR56DRAFT_643384 [Xylariaceae sp. FL0804]